MGKRRYSVDEKVIAKRLKEGRGSGLGREYKPWIQVHEVPSKGKSSIRGGWKTTRDHHLLSNIEANYFFTLEWEQPCLDIREQFPLLPQSETLEIAAELNIPHPRDPTSKCFIIMTTDFLSTYTSEITSKLAARAVKDDDAARNDKRTIEKLLIEKEYWRRRQVNWGIITEKTIDSILVQNVKWIHKWHSPEKFMEGMDYSTYIAICEEMSLYFGKPSDIAISRVTDIFDKQYSFREGTSMNILKHLIAHRKIEADMNVCINTSKPLCLREGN